MRKRAAGIALAISVFVLSLAVAPGIARTSDAAMRACRAGDLSFSYRKGHVKYADVVVKLRSIGIACGTARAVAATVARDTLHNRTVATRIAGLRVRVKDPCAGCTPDWKVSATSDSGTVTFVVEGGA